MSTTVPFRISLIDIDDTSDIPILQSIGLLICLGPTVPKEIRKHITQYDVKKSPKILETYFGKKWKHILQIEDSKRGGNDDDEDNEDALFEDLTLDELMEMEASISKKTKGVPNKIIQLKKKINYNFDIPFYVEDDMKTVREKIAVITNIPYYKQHVFYETFNTQFYATIGYDMEINNDPYTIQLKQIDYSKIEERLLGIPIDRYLYSMYDNAYIKMNEITTSLSYYMDIDVSGTFNVISMDSFFRHPEIKKNIMHLTKIDKEQYYILYRSFVYKYFPVVTEPVFLGYIQNEKELLDMFPELIPSLSTLRKRFIKEYEIVQSLNTITKETERAFKDTFRTKINKLALRTNDIYSDDILNIRTLLNNIHIQSIPNVNFVESILTVHQKEITVTKIHTTNSIPYAQSYSDKKQLFVSLFVEEESLEIFRFLHVYIHMTISTTGIVTVYIQFPPTIILNKHQCIQLLMKKVNPVIDALNKITIAFNSSYRILPLKENGFKYIDTSISLVYNHIISLPALKAIFETFVEADIFRHKTSLEENEYLLHKGITSYSMNRLNTLYYDIQNHYAYLSDLQAKHIWVHLFSNKTIVIKYNVINTVFELNNITMDENKYIKSLLYKVLIHFRKKLEPKDTEALSTNNIHSLKHTDPKLFNFKAKSNYSRVCQKKFQPTLTTLEEIRKKKIKHAIKYWNFTKNKEEYYYCPYQKNKYIGFITDVHPNQYCLPCCKKIQKEDDKYKSCIKDGVYSTSTSQDTSQLENRYILQYGIDTTFENRIVDLPFSLSKLVNEQFDQKLYIYGYVSYNHPMAQTVDLLCIYLDGLDMQVHEFIFMLVKYLQENPDVFPFLLHGTIYEYFDTVQALCKAMVHTFTKKQMIITSSSFEHWNTLLQDILYYYGINTIIFEDMYDGTVKDIKEQVELVLLPHQYTIHTIMKNKKSLLLFRKKENTTQKYKYYPLYAIDRSKYFSDGTIQMKIINEQNPIHATLLHIIQTHVSSSHQTYQQSFTLQNLMEFIQSQRVYILEDLYIDGTQCYAIGIRKKTNNAYIYMSIVHSSLEIIDASLYSFIYTPISLKKHSILPKSFLDFVTQYNIFVYNKTFIMMDQDTFRTKIRSYQTYNQLHRFKNQETHLFDIDTFPFICDPIHITTFLVHKKMVIGCTYNGLYTYFQPPLSITSCLTLLRTNLQFIEKNIECKNNDQTRHIATRTFLCTNDIPIHILSDLTLNTVTSFKRFFKELLYHPNQIHQQLYQPSSSTYLTPIRMKLFNTSMYIRFIYRIFIYVFVHSIKLYQNKDIRQALLKKCKSFNVEQFLSVVNRNNNAYSTSIYTIIYSSLEKKHKISPIVLKEIVNASFNEFIHLLNLNKMDIITDFKKAGNIIEVLLLNNDFMFDMIHMEEIKYLSLDALKKRIEKYTIRHMHFTEKIHQSTKLEPHEEEFIQSKSKNMFYTNKKLNISKKTYKEFIDILAYDLSNPFKRKYILSNLFFDSPLLDTIYFKQFENEKIFINYL